MFVILKAHRFVNNKMFQVRFRMQITWCFNFVVSFRCWSGSLTFYVWTFEEVQKWRERRMCSWHVENRPTTLTYILFVLLTFHLYILPDKRKIFGFACDFYVSNVLETWNKIKSNGFEIDRSLNTWISERTSTNYKSLSHWPN